MVAHDVVSAQKGEVVGSLLETCCIQCCEEAVVRVSGIWVRFDPDLNLSISVGHDKTFLKQGLSQCEDSF